MSGLRQSFLELIREAGNYSGCHQIPERSFFYKGTQFPVCARCCGVFLGQMAAGAIFLFGKRVPVKICCILLGVMGIDWGLQETNIRESTNFRRLVTGFCGGFGLYGLYGNLIRSIFRRLRSGGRRRSPDS